MRQRKMMMMRQKGDMTHASCTVSIGTVKANVMRSSFAAEDSHWINGYSHYGRDVSRNPWTLFTDNTLDLITSSTSYIILGGNKFLSTTDDKKNSHLGKRGGNHIIDSYQSSQHLLEV